MLPETQSSESPFALVARNHHRADFAPAAFDIDLSDRAVRAQNRLERWPCADAIAAANPTSPTQREFCRFSLFSTTQVIELLESCTPNSPQYRL